jgi:hypothetical protein
VPAAARVLFIVAPERPDLMEHLRRQFADVIDTIAVIYDRRMGERRHFDVAVPTDRRRGERRRRDIRPDLSALGWAVVRRCSPE